MTNDGRKGLVISYNVLNLPRSVATMASGSLTYTYLSDGTKVSAIKSDGSGERYLGSFVYSVPSSGSETLESAAWDEGRVSFAKAGSSYLKSDLWFVKDHLGNVRTVVNVTPSLSSPQVLERNDYLPFGTRMDAGTAVIANNRFRLGGKESQTFGSLDLGKVDFGARMYDPFIARWTTADPLAAKYISISPYTFCTGNPINYLDPNGKIVKAQSREARKVIRNALRKEDRRYLSFDRNGFIKNSSLLKNNRSNSVNYQSLLQLSQSDILYVVSIQENYFSDNKITELGGKGKNSGVYGVTLLPGSIIDPSPDDNVYIISSSNLDLKDQVLNYLHEANGHAILYDLMKHGGKVNPNHKYESTIVGEEWDDELSTYIVVNGRKDTNQELVRRIKEAQDEFREHWNDE